MSSSENLRPIDPRERHAILKAFGDAAFARGRNNRRFPECMRGEITDAALDLYTRVTDEGLIPVADKNITESQIEDSLFEK